METGHRTYGRFFGTVRTDRLRGFHFFGVISLLRSFQHRCPFGFGFGHKTRFFSEKTEKNRLWQRGGQLDAEPTRPRQMSRTRQWPGMTRQIDSNSSLFEPSMAMPSSSRRVIVFVGVFRSCKIGRIFQRMYFEPSVFSRTLVSFKLPNTLVSTVGLWCSCEMGTSQRWAVATPKKQKASCRAMARVSAWCLLCYR